MVVPSLHTTCCNFSLSIYMPIINNDPYQVRGSMDYYYSAAAATSNPSSSGSSSVPRNGKERKKVSGKKGGNNGVRLSTDPQSVAARERRHRISDRFKILQSLVPGGTKMDTVSMLEEAINYVKFLKNQIMLHQTLMQLMADHDHDHDHGPDNHDCSFVCLPPPPPPATAGSTTTLPGDHDQQAASYLDIASFVAEVQPPSNSLPCPDSYFQGENDTMHLIYRNN